MDISDKKEKAGRPDFLGGLHGFVVDPIWSVHTACRRKESGYTKSYLSVL